jgi:hypothetical protein
MDDCGSSPVGDEIFLFATASRPALGNVQSPDNWISESFSPGNNAAGT